jgi:hypothetical protein
MTDSRSDTAGSITFTAAELAAEAQRELAQRLSVYGRLVISGKMTQADADRKIALMRQIRDHFAAQAEANPQASGRLL